MGTRKALARAVVVAVAVALPIVVWGRADGPAAAFFRYYRVVDGPLLGAAAAVAAGENGGLVVVRHDRRGWPLGWWFEGLTEAPIVVGSDPRWLGFPEERAGAALAGRFFDRPLTGAAVAALARETGVGRLVFRKREWIGWQRWLGEAAPAVTVVYDDGVFMVVEVGSGSGSGSGSGRRVANGEDGGTRVRVGLALGVQQRPAGTRLTRQTPVKGAGERLGRSVGLDPGR